jgi:nitronate monooxygenase
MTTRFRLSDLKLPVIQAPMAGSGINAPELVIASSRAGVLGSIAAAYCTPEQVRSDVATVRGATDRPFAVNLFAPTTDPEHPGTSSKMLEFLRGWHARFGLAPPQIPDRTSEPFEEMIELLLELRPSVVSFTFGLLPPNVMQALQSRDIFVIGTATTVHEAFLLASSGVDAVVAQGAEAGGHRGSFAATRGFGSVGLMALLPQVIDAIRIPVIASGGIMDGRGIAAALALGAAGVQMGTAFLVTRESGAPECYKKRVLESNDESTVFTNAFSGRFARGIENRFMEEMNQADIVPLPYPWQNAITRPLRKAGAAAGNAEVLSLWAGQASALATEQSVQQLVDSLAASLRDAIQALISRTHAPAPSDIRAPQS